MPADEAKVLQAFSNKLGLASHQAPQTEQMREPSRCRIRCEVCSRAATALAASPMPAFLAIGRQVGFAAIKLRAF